MATKTDNEHLGFAFDEGGHPHAFVVTLPEGSQPCPRCMMTGIDPIENALCTKCQGTGVFPTVPVPDFGMDGDA